MRAILDSIEVRDITGHLIWQSAKKVKEIDILDWKTGVYIVTISK
ncbi:MAG: T9SS type A sorting domain-containing protein [Saprospiraceae bacterium]|nr:T9SS type A sorting domain-containing protein [Saprospiraceae bacterium]